MKKTLTAMALTIGALGSAQAAPVQWTSGPNANGHWYEYIATAVDWTTARADAQTSTFNGMTGYLATVTSVDENTFVGDLASQVDGSAIWAWLGGSDAATDGDWYWIDGPEAGQQFWSGGASGLAVSGAYTHWGSGEPNNCCGGESYLQINSGGRYAWNDDGGPGNAHHLNGYVVEYSSIPEPMTLSLAASALLAGALARRRR